MFDSLWPHGLYSPWNSPGQNTGMGSLSLLQGIFTKIIGIKSWGSTCLLCNLALQQSFICSATNSYWAFCPCAGPVLHTAMYKIGFPDGSVGAAASHWTYTGPNFLCSAQTKETAKVRWKRASWTRLVVSPTFLHPDVEFTWWIWGAGHKKLWVF